VKRNFLLVAGVAAIGFAGYLHAYGQQQVPQQYGNQNQIQQTGATNTVAPLRTRIAVINLQRVIKQYQKCNAFELEYKEKYDAFNRQFEAKRTEAANLKTQLEKAVNDDQREAIQRQMRALDREVQDMGEYAKKELSRLRDGQASQIYREVEMAVQAYARANDLEMVMHFNDVVTKEDAYNPMNLQGKLQTRSLFPMYVADGMDITDTIANMLNQRMGAAAPAAGQR
jgi:Skp family chaperone for outer membrane proteins